MRKLSLGASLVGLISGILFALAPSAATAESHLCTTSGSTGGALTQTQTAAIRRAIRQHQTRLQSSQSGGISVGSGQREQLRRTIQRIKSQGEECNTGPPSRARLVNGKAIAPADAPERVKKAIRWANHIRDKPYRWGGGHGRFFDRGYDCSGAVSFALRGGDFLERPMNSSGLMGWGQRGTGEWITVYSHPGHVYVMIAGLRFDTSGTGGSGPGWTAEKRSTSGFVARHPAGF